MEKIYKEKRFSNFRELLCNSSKEFGSKTAFKIRDGKGYREIRYNEFYKRYITLCTHFLKLGLSGCPIAIIGKNSYEWLLSYAAAATVGVAVPLDKELKAEDVCSLTLYAGCKAVCSDETKISYFERENGEYICENVFDFSQIDKISENFSLADYNAVNSIGIKKDEMQILIFTSGTTGTSKGVCLSQYNICSNIFQTVSMVKIKKTDVTLSMLPIHHTYECTLDCFLLLSRGSCITFADGLTKVAANLTEYKPTILVVVPAILKLLSKRITAGIIKSCPAKYKELFEKNSLSYALSHLPAILRVIICKKVKATLGGRIRLFIVGAAPIEKELIDDFTSLGITTLQGYGLTECSPLLAGNSDFFFDPETTGCAIPGVTLKIDNPNEEGVGEILARGDNIMLGYYKDEEATNKALKDGWFHTGDLGYFKENGALSICGRCKNVIVSEKGKNIFPEELEARILDYPEISEALVLSYKDEEKVLIKAKVFPNLDELKRKLGHIPNEEEAKAAVNAVIKAVNEKLPGYKHIRIVDVLTEAFEKTSTRKIKRFGSNVK